jgi:hypothetical protein
MPVGDRWLPQFPAVLARTWHGACWSHAQDRASGIVELMSSKTARLRRRQAAQRNKYKRLRKSGRVPQHTRAERRRAAAERQRQQGVDQRRQERLRQVVPTITASFMFVPLAEVSSGHHSSLYLSAAELARAETPDLPHMPERDMTFYAPSLAQRTARTNRSGPGQISPGTNSACRPSTL